MALERDNQHITAAGYMGPMLVQNGLTATGGTIDTKGLRSLSFVFTPSQPYNVADVIDISAQESADGINWTALNTYKELPTEHYGNQICVNTIAPWLQTHGVVCSERYVRLRLTGTNIVGMGDTIYVIVIGHPEQLPFRAWDPAALLGDGNP